MLTITIPAIELYDEKNNLFTYSRETELKLEHSLVSISKWESEFCKPFLTKNNKTPKETLEYIKAMTITQNVDSGIYNLISQDNLDLITAYIDAPMTATIIPANKSSINREVITSELIYYWMISFNIPFECQRWHLNRLLTLINVCNIKNQPKKKLSQRELMSRNRALNEARKAELKTKG
jgi:hypothetical protein